MLKQLIYIISIVALKGHEHGRRRHVFQTRTTTKFTTTLNFINIVTSLPRAFRTEYIFKIFKFLVLMFGIFHSLSRFYFFKIQCDGTPPPQSLLVPIGNSLFKEANGRIRLWNHLGLCLSNYTIYHLCAHDTVRTCAFHIALACFCSEIWLHNYSAL